RQARGRPSSRGRVHAAVQARQPTLTVPAGLPGLPSHERGLGPLEQAAGGYRRHRSINWTPTEWLRSARAIDARHAHAVDFTPVRSDAGIERLLGPVAHLGFVVDDLEEAVDFWARVFGAG